ncbi:MAG TPA: DUF3093 domain-containing protein [Streptosporangiaceae bacterium]
MDNDRGVPGGRLPGPAQYRERLRVPAAWWLLAVPVVVVLGAEFYEVLSSPWPPVIIVCFAAACAVLLILLGRAEIEVDAGDGTLKAGGQTLRLAAVHKVAALDERQTARLRGPSADPAAYLYSRPYLKRSVYLGLDDGGVPYWLIGTRHPAELAAVVEKHLAREEPVA